MPSHPEVQRKAHEELDRVVGRDNWPSAEDEHRLPYIRAIIKEILRFHSPFWMGTPHCSEKDFVYNGMYIPADTVMVLNCYTIHHNEDRYPDP
jgi:cytochrome P450